MTLTGTSSNETPRAKRLLLRAEITGTDWRVVGHTLEVTPSSLFVQTHETAYIGDRLDVKLSFPGLLDALQLTGHVVSQMLPGEPGEPRGLTLALTFRNHHDEQMLRELLLRGESNDAGQQRAPYRVLVIEDSRLIQQMFQYGVNQFFRGRSNQVDVDFCESVEAGWDRVQLEPYNLAIIDYFLPDFLGSELIRRIRGNPGFTTLPIIAVSVGGEAACAASLHAGADIFLDKPLIFRDLFTTIDQLVPLRLCA